MKKDQQLTKIKEILAQIDKNLEHIQVQESVSSIDKDLLLQKIRDVYETALELGNGKAEALDENVEIYQEEVKEAITEAPPQEEVPEETPISVPPAVNEIIDEDKIEVVEPKEEIKEPVVEVPEKVVEPVAEKRPEVSIEKPTPKVASSRLESDLFSEVDDNSINKKIGSSQTDESIGKRLQQKKIEDLKVAIGINDKFLMMNELFGGRLDAYNQAVDLLNAKKDYDEARNSFMDLGKQYGWEIDNRAAEILMNFIERRYL